MCMQTFFTIFHSVQEIGPLSLFQKLDFGITSTDDKCHFAIPWARSCQYQCVCKILSKYKCIPVMGNFRKPSTDGHTRSHKLTGDKHKTVHGQITKKTNRARIIILAWDILFDKLRLPVKFHLVRFRNYGQLQLSQTDYGRTHGHSAIIVHTPKVNLQLLCRSTFSKSCNNNDICMNPH